MRLRRLGRPEEVFSGNIGVFAAVNNGLPKFMQDARRLGELIGQRGYNLVYGGVGGGLMRQVAEGARSQGSKITGVLPGGISQFSAPEIFDDLEPYSDELVVSDSLTQRKLTMLDLSDGIIGLPGGFGTLDEIVTTLEMSRGKVTSGVLSRLAVVNTLGFYDGLRHLLATMQTSGLTAVSAETAIHFADTPEAALDIVVSRIDIAKNAVG